MNKKYGIKIKFKKQGEMVLPLPNVYEWRRDGPVFAFSNGSGQGQSILTVGEIRRNWNSWAKDYFVYTERLSIDDAEDAGYEIL